jgi:hypothetical protein
MTDEASGWADALGISAAQTAEFERLTASMGSSPPAILNKLVAHVLEVDRQLGDYGLRGLPSWITQEQSVDRLVDHGIDGL